MHLKRKICRNLVRYNKKYTRRFFAVTRKVARWTVQHWSKCQMVSECLYTTLTELHEYETTNRQLDQLTVFFYHTKYFNEPANWWTGRHTGTLNSGCNDSLLWLDKQLHLRGKEFQFIRQMSLLSVPVATGFQYRLFRKNPHTVT
jgi:hypothetical protein